MKTVKKLTLFSIFFVAGAICFSFLLFMSDAVSVNQLSGYFGLLVGSLSFCLSLRGIYSNIRKDGFHNERLENWSIITIWLNDILTFLLGILFIILSVSYLSSL